MDDERLKALLTKDIVQDIPLMHIIKVYVALLEVEDDKSNITGIKQE